MRAVAHPRLRHRKTTPGSDGEVIGLNDETVGERWARGGGGFAAPARRDESAHKDCLMARHLRRTDMCSPAFGKLWLRGHPQPRFHPFNGPFFLPTAFRLHIRLIIRPECEGVFCPRQQTPASDKHLSESTSLHSSARS